MVKKSELDLIEITLNELSSIFDLNLTSKIIDSLEKNYQKNISFLSEKFCNSKGKFNFFFCICNVGVYGRHCNKLGIEFWGKKIWILFQIFFSILFFIFMLVMIIKLIISILNFTSFLSGIFSLFTIPKHLVNINLIIMSTSKFIYMIYDPYCQYNKVSYQYDRVMNELSISSIVSIYLLLFIIFVGLRVNLTRGKGLLGKKTYLFIYNCLKLLIILSLSTIYPIQIYLSLHFSKNSITKSITILKIYAISAFFCFLIYILTFCIICRTRTKLFKYYHIKKIDENRNKNIHIKIINNRSDDSLNHNSNSIIQLDNNYNNHKSYFKKKKNNNIIELLEKMISENKIDIVDYSIGRDIENNETQYYENEDTMFFEDEMKILNQYSNNPKLNLNINTEKHITENENELLSISSLTIKKKNKKFKRRKAIFYPEIEKEDYNDDYTLNENDLILVHNIFIHSFLFMLVSILYFIYFSGSKNVNIISNHWALLFVYTFLHIIELMYMLAIYAVFFKYTTSQEYKNLIYIGELKKYLNIKFNDISKIIVIFKDLAESTISERFKGIINFG